MHLINRIVSPMGFIASGTGRSLQSQKGNSGSIIHFRASLLLTSTLSNPTDHILSPFNNLHFSNEPVSPCSILPAFHIHLKYQRILLHLNYMTHRYSQETWHYTNSHWHSTQIIVSRDKTVVFPTYISLTVDLLNSIPYIQSSNSTHLLMAPGNLHTAMLSALRLGMMQLGELGTSKGKTLQTLTSINKT